MPPAGSGSGGAAPSVAALTRVLATSAMPRAALMCSMPGSSTEQSTAHSLSIAERSVAAICDGGSDGESWLRLRQPLIQVGGPFE